MSLIQPQNPLPGTQQATMSPQVNQLVQRQQTPQIVQPNQIVRGSIIVFNYSYWKNDKTPCVLVSSVDGTYLSGVNIHYLPFATIRGLLPSANPSFSYFSIKKNTYIVDAFRSYLIRGIDFSKAKIVDSKFLLQMMALANSFDPNQIKAIRQQIEQQLSMSSTQPQAAPSPATIFGTTPANPVI